MKNSKECYWIAAHTQTIGVRRLEADPEAYRAIEKMWHLIDLLGKVRFTKNFVYTLSTEGAVQGGTPLAQQLYEAMKNGCFEARGLWREGQFDPRLASFWSGLATHPVLVHMQPQRPLPYCRWPAPRPDPNPMIAAGLNDFLKQLEPRWTVKRFKTHLSKHQALYSKRVERIGTRLEQLMSSHPGASWVSLSMWFAMPALASQAQRTNFMGACCSVVESAVRTSLSHRKAVTLLRPSSQRDGWVRVDGVLASPNIFYSEREVLAQHIVRECDRTAKVEVLGMAHLSPMNEVDTYRVYTADLGHWEATRRLALYFGGADLAISHCILKDTQLFSLDIDLLSVPQLDSVGLSQASWPFSRVAAQKPQLW